MCPQDTPSDPEQPLSVPSRNPGHLTRVHTLQPGKLLHHQLHINWSTPAVILAKIKKAVFSDYVKPGDTIRLRAEIESIVSEAATTSGRITRVDKVIAEIDLMFSHIDQNLAGIEFPEENFVFDSDTSVFESLLRDVLSVSGKESERN